MRWYINDLSLQGQFTARCSFESVLRELVSARARIEMLRNGLRTTRTLRARLVSPDGEDVRGVLLRSNDVDLRRAVLSWFDRTGPFIEDDRTDEQDDYFEHSAQDVTDTGLGEAARRIKRGEHASTFSFCGGNIDFERSPLLVLHGISEARLGTYGVSNLWHVASLTDSAISATPPATTWKSLVKSAGERFPRLMIGNEVYENAVLAKEPFDGVIRDRAFELMRFLNRYMEGLDEHGVEGAQAQEVIENFFRGDRALFSGESSTNRRAFVNELTFPDPEDRANSIFAHWHGKISHRHFRMHFEWPVPTGARRLKIVYLGPKLTKT